MSCNNPLIVIIAGGTGGHVLPAQVFEQHLSKDIDEGTGSCKLDTFFISDSRVRHLFAKSPDLCLHIGSANFKSIVFWARMALSFIKSFFCFIKRRPKAIVSFGGYVTAPALVAAIILRIPFFLHEQNAVLGKVNRMFSKFAYGVMLGFRNTLSYGAFDSMKPGSVIFTGNPVRDEFHIRSIKEGTHSPDADDDDDDGRVHILVVGGSQGAMFFSDAFPSLLMSLPPQMQSKLEVWQQCRVDLIEQTRGAYDGFQGTILIKPFFDDIATLMGKSDLVFTRGGASTLAELAVMGKFAVIVPLKNAIYDHQTLNAIEHISEYSGILIKEDEFLETKVTKSLIEGLCNGEKYDTIKANYVAGVCLLMSNHIDKDLKLKRC
jgi:UDP-N-acetylglucosamine--N-acetylmuramyl-(pentapeptide) pyrophosphoryl-undecaprenol N-acetylglucosamine transferase